MNSKNILLFDASGIVLGISFNKLKEYISKNLTFAELGK